MDKDLNGKHHGNLAISGRLLVDLASMKKGFFEVKRYRREIWDYLQYRGSLVKWSSMNEQIRGGAL